jgi:hypothetical protein
LFCKRFLGEIYKVGLIQRNHISKSLIIIQAEVKKILSPKSKPRIVKIKNITIRPDWIPRTIKSVRAKGYQYKLRPISLMLSFHPIYRCVFGNF